MRQKETSNGKIKYIGDYYQIDVKSGAGVKICSDDEDRDYLLSVLGDFALAGSSVEIIAYQISDNCFSIIVSQVRKDGASKIMCELINHYNKYFSAKYKVSDVFVFDKCLIQKIEQNDLLKASYKMHLLSDDWMFNQNTSICAYFYDDTPDWLNKDHLKSKYSCTGEYFNMLNNSHTNNFEVSV